MVASTFHSAKGYAESVHEKDSCRMSRMFRECLIIACSHSTKSELVVPILDHHRNLIAVLDIDSDTIAAFDEIDETNLTLLNKYFQGKSR